MSRKRAKKGPSERQLRVGEQLRQALSEALMDGGLKDPRLAGDALPTPGEGGASDCLITVTEVRMTPDLKTGVVLVSIFPEEPAMVRQVMDGLRSAEASLKREIAARLALRFTPSLRFIHDDSIVQGAKIDQLLADIAAEERAADPDPDPESESEA